MRWSGSTNNRVSISARGSNYASRGRVLSACRKFVKKITYGCSWFILYLPQVCARAYTRSSLGCNFIRNICWRSCLDYVDSPTRGRHDSDTLATSYGNRLLPVTQFRPCQFYGYSAANTQCIRVKSRLPTYTEGVTSV